MSLSCPSPRCLENYVSSCPWLVRSMPLLLRLAAKGVVGWNSVSQVMLGESVICREVSFWPRVLSIYSIDCLVGD